MELDERLCQHDEMRSGDLKRMHRIDAPKTAEGDFQGDRHSSSTAPSRPKVW